MRPDRLIGILALALLVGTAACGGGGGGGSTDPGPTTYSISGRVLDINGNGVPDVAISVEAPGQSYPLTTNQSGNYTISFQTPATFTIRASKAGYDITPVSREVTTATLNATPTVSGINFNLDSAIIRFNPPTLTIPGVDQTGLMYVAVDEVTDLFTVHFIVTFDPSVLEVTDLVTMADGFFFDVDGASIIPLTTIDNEAGTIDIGLGVLNVTGVSGSGILAGITFRGKQAGSSILSFITTGDEDLVLTRYPQTDGGVPELEPVIPYTATVTVNP